MVSPEKRSQSNLHLLPGRNLRVVESQKPRPTKAEREQAQLQARKDAQNAHIRALSESDPDWEMTMRMIHGADFDEIMQGRETYSQKIQSRFETLLHEGRMDPFSR